MRCTHVAILTAALALACTNSSSTLPQLYGEAQRDVRRGAISDALKRIDRATALAPETSNDWGLAFVLLRAEALLLRRDTAAALAILESVQPSAAPRPWVDGKRTYLKCLASVFQGKLAGVLDTLDVARKQTTGELADEVLLDIDILRAQVYLRTGRSSEADSVLRDVLARASARRDVYHKAVALHNAGHARMIANHFDDALTFFERVLELREVQPYIIYGTALNNAGLCYARLGHFDKAIAFQLQAIAGHEARDVPVYLEQAFGELGNTYMLKEDQRRGFEYLSQAFNTATAANLTSDAAVWAGNLAKVAIDLGDFDKAEQFNREAIRLKKLANRDTLYNTFYSALIAAGRGQLAEARRLYQAVIDASGQEAGILWEAHDGFARTALAAGNKAIAADHFAAALATIQATRSDLLKTEHRVTFLARVVRFYQTYVDTLIATGDVSRALEVADSSRGVVLAERMGGGAPTGVASTSALVAAAARSRSVWLSYWLAPTRSYVWVVSGNGVNSAALPGAAEIERLVEQHRKAIEHSSADPLATSGSAGDALYKALVAPIARFIPHGASVRIVPDGALHGINFETLPVDGPQRHYWIEDVTIAIAPSLGLLASAAGGRAERPESGSLLLVGDPTPRVREFPRLRYAPIEMRSVSAHFKSGTVSYDGDRASPSGYLGARPERFSVIHFTAHAEANRTSPLDSAVILSGPAGADKLYARDVADRSLRADLVTISACRSAGERAYAGEGLIGFSWAFLRAGARQVVAGLWDVDDQSTATLMDKLYAGIAAGKAAPDALREAKLTLMRQQGNVARPYYWGPFEVFTVSP